MKAHAISSRGWIGAAIVGAAVVVLAGCARESRLPPPHAIARVGERTLHYSNFERYLEQNVGGSGASNGENGASGSGESIGALASDALSRLLDQFLGEELLVALARERGLADVDDPSDRAVGALIASRPAKVASAAAVAAAYEQSRESLASPERVHLRQILLEDRLSAERARRELVAGADFAAVVARLTPKGGAPAGADQGELARDELPPAFADLVFRLPEGGVSDVVAAEYGFHVFQVVKHRPATVPELAEARPAIEDRLRREAADAVLAQLSAEARSRYTVEVYERNLPFTYRGAFPVSRPQNAP